LTLRGFFDAVFRGDGSVGFVDAFVCGLEHFFVFIFTLFFRDAG
jgi:hypothetical protein